MGLHIEISGDATALEWRAVATLAAAMLGDAPTPAVRIETTVKAAPKSEGRVPLPPVPTATVVDAPYVEPVDVPGMDLADQLIAGEEARVATLGELPTFTPPPGAELDSVGLPHDLRIHSAEKTKNKDNTWRRRRGIDPALVAHVEAELKAIMAAPVPEAPTLVDPAAAFGSPAPVSSIPPPPAGAGEAVPAPPVPEASPALDNMGEFARVMRVVVDKQKAGTLPTETTGEIAKSLGLTSVRDLAKRPDLIPAFEALLP